MESETAIERKKKDLACEGLGQGHHFRYADSPEYLPHDSKKGSGY
jgi:hypothetical protein